MVFAVVLAGCGGSVVLDSGELDVGAEVPESAPDAGSDAGPDCAKLPPLAECAPGRHCAITAGPPLCVPDEDAGAPVRCTGLDGVKAPDGSPCLVCVAACAPGSCFDGECKKR